MYSSYRLILETVNLKIYTFLFLSVSKCVMNIFILSNWEVYLYEINRKLMLFLIIFTDKPNDNTVITKVKYILSCISQGSKHGGFSFSQGYQQLF